jgi:hypothetical protein
VCPRNFYSWPPQNERCSRDHPLHRLPHALATAISNTSCQDLSCPSPHLKINLLEATDPASSRVTFLTCRWYIDVDFDRAGVHAMRHLCRLHARHTRQELSHSSHAYRLTRSAIMRNDDSNILRPSISEKSTSIQPFCLPYRFRM